MTAREYLRRLQLRQIDPAAAGNLYDQRIRQRYLDLIDAAKPEYRTGLEENLRKRDASDAKYLDWLPTPFQSLQDFRRLVEAKERIDVTLRGVGEFEPRENLILGSIETENLNAMATFRADSGEYLVVFNRGLLLTLLAASNFVICALSMDRKPRWGEAVDTVEEDILRKLSPKFADLLHCVCQGRVPGAEITVPLFPRLEKEIRWTKLEDAAMQFAFAHEYAHVLLGHLSDAAGQELSEDRGGWGREYEADSLALDLVTQTWLDEERLWSGTNENNPLVLAFLLQGVCLFFTMICQIEQYSAETRGKSTGIWSSSRSHPPTLLRWVRMLHKAGNKTPEGLWKSVIRPQVITIERCLSLYYAASVGLRESRTPAALEWNFQRTALEALAKYNLVPPHMFIAARCARAALVLGAPLNETEVTARAVQADAELEAGGARPLRDYKQPLATVTRHLSEHALAAAQIVGTELARKFVDRLADIFILDARTRYPLVASTA